MGNLLQQYLSGKQKAMGDNQVAVFWRLGMIKYYQSVGDLLGSMVNDLASH